MLVKLSETAGAYVVDKYNQAFITKLASVQSFIVNRKPYSVGSNNEYAWKSSPLDYITIPYGPQGDRTGNLKVVTSPHPIVDEAFPENDEILANNSCWIDNSMIMDELFVQKPIPEWWNFAVFIKLNNLSKKLRTGNSGSMYSGGVTIYSVSAPAIDILEDTNISKFVKDFYDNMQDLIPILMAYRWHSQVFSNYTNKQGISVVDYENDDNNVQMKAVPVMDVSKIEEVFNVSWDPTFLNSPQSFNYDHCIVDLNPTNDAEYADLPSGKFPMKFANSLSVNTDEYKTSKLVLTRIDSISANNFDTFEMGSHSTDYAAITDEAILKHKDPEAIVEGSVDNNATVKLVNGGDDVNYTADTEAKRHFFIDPFELTIAQWCYIKGWKTKDDARDGLAANLDEIQTSYWRYLSVWEKQEWQTWKEGNETDEACINRLVEDGTYNPLNDTRPYYYATYISASEFMSNLNNIVAFNT